VRYFPNSSFLDYNLRHNTSCPWCSIWFTRHILANGCRWRIGDGASVRVMKDPLLHVHEASCVSSPHTREVHNFL